MKPLAFLTISVLSGCASLPAQAPRQTPRAEAPAANPAQVQNGMAINVGSLDWVTSTASSPSDPEVIWAPGSSHTTSEILPSRKEH